MNQQRDGRLGIGIIGAGKVGPILGAALAGAGHALPPECGRCAAVAG